MLVTQNNDGSLTIQVDAADLALAVSRTMERIPLTNQNFLLGVAGDLSADIATTIRSANVSFDQAVTDNAASVVQKLADDRATAIAAKPAPVTGVVGP
jgi:hypothetical protein